MPIRAADLEYDRITHYHVIYTKSYCHHYIDFPVGCDEDLNVYISQVDKELLYRLSVGYIILVIEYCDNKYTYSYEVESERDDMLYVRLWSVEYANTSHTSPTYKSLREYKNITIDDFMILIRHKIKIAWRD